MNPKQNAASTPLDLNLVRIWLRVVELGSFTHAAQELGLPTSSVSRAVTRLETELGVTLLARSTRKLNLTPAGTRYLQAARGAIQSLDTAQAELTESEGEPRGLVRMTAPMPTGSRIDTALSRAVVAFHVRYPEVHLELMLTGRRIDLLAEGVDLALRGGAMGDERLVARKLGRERAFLVASPAYLTRAGTPKTIDDLTRHRCVLVNAEHGSQRWTLTGKAGSETVLVHGPVSVDEVPFAVSLAEAELGIALVPSMLAERRLGAGRLVRVLPEYGVLGSAVSLVYPKLAHVPRRVAVLREFMYEFLHASFASSASPDTALPANKRLRRS